MLPGEGSNVASKRGIRRDLLGLLAVLLVTAAIFWPGLSGSYLFDDFPNIVENPEVHVATSNWPDWLAAAKASPVADFPRPLAMLSFAANYYFTQLDPLPMKLTNLLVHLLNGLLLWAVLTALLQLWNARREVALPDQTIRWTAVGISTAWLICPINLSPVLYVVQRMESLAQIFVLAGLWIYLHGRLRISSGRPGTLLCAAGLIAGTAGGLLCKESAVLLPLYAFLAELLVLNFETPKHGDRRKLFAVFALGLFVPAAIGLYWLLPRFGPGAFAGRPFTLPQRLMTECRVLVDYGAWTLFPRPDDLGFYHDDIAISRGWFSPASTVFSAIFLLASLIAAAAWRRKLPLVSLGIAWFFAAHLLTATVIPLELVFEHRNYFSSAGLLLAAAGLILEIPPDLKLLRLALPMLAILVLGAMTALRATEWSNPIRFAYAEADQHPNSPRALYELGHTLTIASGYRKDSKLIEPAIQAFQTASGLQGTSAAPLASLILVASHTNRPVNPKWWENLTSLLASRPISVDDLGALESLSDCQRKGECTPQVQELLSAYLAALSHPGPSPGLLANYGAFCANALHDYPLGVEVTREALALRPGSVEYRIELSEIEILNGDASSALAVLESLKAAHLNQEQTARAANLKHSIESKLPQQHQGT